MDESRLRLVAYLILSLMTGAGLVWLSLWIQRELIRRLPKSSSLVWFVGATFCGLPPGLCAVCFLVGLRPIFGLIAALLVLLLPAVLLLFLSHHERRYAEKAGIGYLRTLLGLLRSGMGLPAALFLLAETWEGALAKPLSRTFSRFERGTSLSDCLSELRQRKGFDRASTLLVILESAYQRGLPVVPLLERFIPALESEQQLEGRLDKTRISVFVQSFIAASVPWVLAAAMAFFAPEIWQNLSRSGSLVVKGGLVLLWESLGIYFLRRVCRYY